MMGTKVEPITFNAPGSTNHSPAQSRRPSFTPTTNSILNSNPTAIPSTSIIHTSPSSKREPSPTRAAPHPAVQNSSEPPPPTSPLSRMSQGFARRISRSSLSTEDRYTDGTQVPPRGGLLPVTRAERERDKMMRQLSHLGYQTAAGQADNGRMVEVESFADNTTSIAGLNEALQSLQQNHGEHQEIISASPPSYPELDPTITATAIPSSPPSNSVPGGKFSSLRKLSAGNSAASRKISLPSLRAGSGNPNGDRNALPSSDLDVASDPPSSNSNINRRRSSSTLLAAFNNSNSRQGSLSISNNSQSGNSKQKPSQSQSISVSPLQNSPAIFTNPFAASPSSTLNSSEVPGQLSNSNLNNNLHNSSIPASPVTRSSTNSTTTTNTSYLPNSPTTPSSINSRPSTRVSFDFAGANEARQSHSRRPSATVVSSPPTVQSISQIQQPPISAQLFREDEEMDDSQLDRSRVTPRSADISPRQSTSRGLRDTMRGLASQSSEVLGIRRSMDVRPELAEISGARASTDTRRQRFSGFLKNDRNNQGQNSDPVEEISSQPSSSNPATPSRLSFSAFRASRASGEFSRRSRRNSTADRPVSDVEPRTSEDPDRSLSGERESGQNSLRKRKVSGFLKKVGIGGVKKEKGQRSRSGGSSQFQDSPPLPQSPSSSQRAAGFSRSDEMESEAELSRDPAAAFERAFGKPTQGALRSPDSSASLNANVRDRSRHSRNSSSSSGLRNEVSPFPASSAAAPRAVAQLQAAESSNRQSIISGDGSSFHSATSSPVTSTLTLPNNEDSSSRSGLPSSSSRPFEWVDSFGITGTGRTSGLEGTASSPSESASGTDHTNSSRSTSGGVQSVPQGKSNDVTQDSTSTANGGEKQNQIVIPPEETRKLQPPPSGDDRRRSIGIDEEQDQNDASAALSAAAFKQSTSPSSRPTISSSSNAPPSRPTRSVAGLSHMPRLNSMRGSSGGGGGAAGGSGGQRNDGGSSGGAAGGRDDDEDEGHESGGGAGDDSEEDVTDDEEDEDGHADDSRATMDDMETDTEGEEEEVERQRARARVAASMPMPGGFTGFGLVASPSASLANSQELPSAGSSGILRARPDEIALPPRPSFIPQSSPDTSNKITPMAFSTPSVAVGKQAWTSFNATPFESPFETPKATNGMIPEPSYFSHQPAPARNVGSMSQAGGDGPPPSPSVITRSRAPSSASGRTLGQAPSRSMTTPGREIPVMPPATLDGLDFTSRDKGRSNAVQSSGSSGVDSRASSIQRSKSGRKDSTPKIRPSTAGDTLPANAADIIRNQDLIAPVPSIPSVKVEGSTLAERRQPGSSQQPSLAPAFGFSKPSSGSDRPGLYHHKSKSLIDLSSDRMHDRNLFSTESFAKSRNQSHLLPGISTGQQDTSRVGDKSKQNRLEALPTPMSPSLRRRSMIELRVEPPPYTVIHRRPEGPQVIYPREEEGKEKLPLYNCSVHIEGYLPRKMEFSAPGVQAKDRSWKRQYVVLHGTCLRVYKTDAVAGLAAQGAWGNMKGVHVHLEPMNEDGPGSISSVAPGQSPFVTQSNQTHPGSNNGTNGAASGHEKSGSHSGPRLAAAKEVLTGVAHAPLSFAHASHSKDPATSAAVSAEARTHHGVIRNYTLQSAESGLAADYLKRRHVVRVRAEGEQFLLHTRSDRHVVDWIEALQAATNVSMDLEKRQMPKFITLPRRRRRRRRNPDGSTSPMSAAEAEARDLAEAQRRSLADTMGGAPTPSSRRDRSNRSNDDGQTPSAAFDERLDEMLREEHADISSRAAADI